ncbi:MAG: hypothetical protein ACK5N4_04545 [Parabacteroides gordonii]|uniref:hypothetical protein n=1 Tax=Parabacteroides gordonii TaxID=574930 RepID=UPI003A852809
MKAEGGKGILFCDEETCLNLDKIEKVQHKQTPQATMDLTIGLSPNQKTRQMLLVELRFNYKCPQNIKKQDIIDKIAHSKELLTGSVIYPEYIFIFKDNICNQARNHFFRLFSGKKTNCCIMSESEFYSLFF